jgi:hypothetical protein
MSAQPSAASVKDAADHLRTTAVEGFHQLAHDLDGGLGELSGAIGKEINAHPLRCVLLAAGAGYLIGGGFAAPLTRRLTRLGMRALLIPLLEQPTASFVEWVRSEFDPSSEAGSSDARSTKTSNRSSPRSTDESPAAKGAKSHGT